jgi:hypothetical protein
MNVADVLWPRTLHRKAFAAATEQDLFGSSNSDWPVFAKGKTNASL